MILSILIMKISSGFFIVIEGIDGSGKTTLSRIIADWMKDDYKCNVFLTREPTDSEYGKMLREILKNKNSDPVEDALLFALDRVRHCSEIKKHIENGEVVISDRYLTSSLAYQSVQGLDLSFIRNANLYAVSPNLELFLNVNPTVGIKRIDSMEKQKEKFENLDFLEKLYTQYLDIYRSKMNRWHCEIVPDLELGKTVDFCKKLIIQEMNWRGIKV